MCHKNISDTNIAINKNALLNEYKLKIKINTSSIEDKVSSMVRAFAHGAMGRWAISHSSQCSTTGVTKAVACAILSEGWCI